MDAVRIERFRNTVLLATGGLYAAGYALNGIVWLLGTAVGEAVSRTWRWVPTSLDRPLVAFVSAAFLSALFSEWRRDSMMQAALLCVTVVVSVRAVAAFAVGGTDRCLRFLKIWVAGGVAAALWVTVQFDPTGFVLPGTPPLGSNGAGTTLAVSAVIAMGLLVGPAAGRRWLIAAAVAVLLAGLAATWARGAWLGAAVGMLTLLAVGVHPRARPVVALLTILVVGLGASLLPRWPEFSTEVRSIGSLEANKNRLAIWSVVPKMVADHPVVGTGFGMFGRAYPRYRLPDAPDLTPPFAHNLLLNAAVEAGVLGLLAIVAVCAAGLLSSWRWMMRSAWGTPERTVATAVFVGLVALLANQTVDGTVMSVHVSFGFFALLALGAAGERYLSHLHT